MTIESPVKRQKRPQVVRRASAPRSLAAQRAPAVALDGPTVHHFKDAEATENSNSDTATSAGVGTKSDASIQEAPQTISGLTRKRLDEQNLTTVEDALRNVTGMTVLNADAGDRTPHGDVAGHEHGCGGLVARPSVVFLRRPAIDAVRPFANGRCIGGSCPPLMEQNRWPLRDQVARFARP